VYYPLVALRDGVNPYAVETYYRHYPVGQEFPLYTPIHLVLHSPLLLFSFPVARAVAFGWNVALVLGYAAVVLRLIAVRLTPASVFGLGTLILLSDPGKFDLRTGQPTLILATRNDGAVSFDHAEHLAATMRHATLVEVDTPTHLLWLGEGSDHTTAAIQSFMRL